MTNSYQEWNQNLKNKNNNESNFLDKLVNIDYYILAIQKLV